VGRCQGIHLHIYSILVPVFWSAIFKDLDQRIHNSISNLELKIIGVVPYGLLMIAVLERKALMKIFFLYFLGNPSGIVDANITDLTFANPIIFDQKCTFVCSTENTEF
jgi:hypothetical protein